MPETKLSGDLNNTYLCRDYSSFIKWSLDKISKTTDKWTDFSISEPDTLMLSSIAVMHDYAQYIIDEVYMNTDLDICSTEFLYKVSAAMGKYLLDTNVIKIPVTVVNRSNDFLTIRPYEVFNFGSEVFTNPEELILAPFSSINSYVVRNTVNNKLYKILDNTKGEYYLKGNIELGSLNVYAIDENGVQELLSETHNIFDILFNKSKCYQISSESSKLFKIKISPDVFRNYRALLVKYTTADDYPIKSDLKIYPVKDIPVSIEVNENVSINSEVPIDTNKLNYLLSLNIVNTLCNKIYDIDLGQLLHKIKNYRISYEPSSSKDILPIFEYTTYNDKALFGDYTHVNDGYAEEYLVINNIYFSSGNNILHLVFNSFPPYDVIIKYNSNSKIIVLKQSDLMDRIMDVNLKDYNSSSDIFIEFQGLGNIYKIYKISNNRYEIEIVNSEQSILLNNFSSIVMIGHKLPIIRFLSPRFLQLNCTIEISYSIPNLISKIIELLYSVLIHGEIINNMYINYRRLEVIIENNIEGVISVNFDSTMENFYVESNKYLAFYNDLNDYESEINVKMKGDV